MKPPGSACGRAGTQLQIDFNYLNICPGIHSPKTMELSMTKDHEFSSVIRQFEAFWVATYGQQL